MGTSAPVIARYSRHMISLVSSDGGKVMVAPTLYEVALLDRNLKYRLGPACKRH